MSLFTPLISVNGRLNGHISPLDRGFNYGDGVFETLRVSACETVLWEYHRQRLTRSCAVLGIALDVAKINQYRVDLLNTGRRQGIDEAILKIVISRGEGGRGYAAAEALLPTVCMGLYPLAQYPSNHWSQGVSVVICQQRLSGNRQLAGLKHLSKLEYVMARREWQGNTYAEGILRDEFDRVIEAISSNVFCVKDGELLTPRLDRCGVAGVMRGMVRDVFAPIEQITVKEAELSLRDLMQAEEIFLTNSVNGIWPVQSLCKVNAAVGNDNNNCNNNIVYEYKPGKLTRRLQYRLNEFLAEQECHQA